MSKWKDTAELVGMAAIVVSLLLLAYEVRLTRLATLGDTYQTRALSAADANDDYANSPYLPQLDIKYTEEGLEAFSAEERSRFRANAQGTLDRLDALYYLYELGLIDDNYHDYVVAPRFDFWAKRWQELGLLDDRRVRPAFKAELDRVLKANDIE